MEEEETTSSSRRTGKRHITGGGSSAVNRGKGIGGGAFGAKKAKVSGPETGPETESAPAQSMSDTGKSWWGSSTSLARRLFSFLTTGGSDPPQRTSFLRVPGFAEKYSESFKDEKKEKEGRGEEKKRGGEKGGERKEGGKSLFFYRGLHCDHLATLATHMDAVDYRSAVEKSRKHSFFS